MDELARYDVFISYSHADGAWVRGWLQPQLEAAGLRVCIDERDFAIGVPGIINIERAVEQSRHTLLVLTPAWVANEWTGLESLLAQTDDPTGLRQRLLPLLLQPCQPPRRISILTYADFTDPQQHPRQTQRVIETIQGRQHLADLGPTLGTLSAQHGTLTDRNRTAMIQKVRHTWIASLLDQSVAKEARIALGLEARPDAVIDPVDLVVQRPGRTAQQLPAGTAIRDIYDQFGGALLILGAPGAGKTTLLLELARDLLDRANDDPQHPIPVVFPLSTWAEQRRPLEQWLVDELNKRYAVPRKLAQAWIESDAILPLLDGLDEVAEPHRNACTDAINLYRQTRGHFPLVVASRLVDYEALTTRLQLHGAIVVQPLSRDQVRTYLRAVGVAAIPTRDSPLWELLDTPLMLTVAALTYAGQPLVALPSDPVVARKQLFAAYIDRMFERNNPQRLFTDAQTRQYLAFLAHQMQQHNQTILYLENLQPDWLPVPARRYWRIPVTLSGRLVFGLAFGLVFGSVGMVLFVLLFVLLYGLFDGLILGLLLGLATGLVGMVESSIKPIEVVTWSWEKANSFFRQRLRLILVSQLVITLVNALFHGLVLALFYGLLYGLSYALVILVLGGVSERTIEHKTLPNQGIQRSGMNALLVGLVLGLATGLGFVLVHALVNGLVIGLVGVLIDGLVIGLVGVLCFGLVYGGTAYLQHYLLRLLLSRTGSIPRRLVPFLDYSTQRIFLQRVGGGYIFIHRLLLEHFAAKYTTPGASPQAAPADEP